MDQLRANTVYERPTLTVITVNHARVAPVHSQYGYRCHAECQPIAIIVKRPTGVEALDMRGEDVDISLLCRKVPELAELLAPT